MDALRTLPEALADAARSDNATVSSARTAITVRMPTSSGRRSARAFARRGGSAPRDCVRSSSRPRKFPDGALGASIAGVIPASVYAPATMGDPPHYYELTSASSAARRARSSRQRRSSPDRGAARELSHAVARARSGSARRAAMPRPSAGARRHRTRAVHVGRCPRRRASRSRTRTSRRTSTRSTVRPEWPPRPI